MAELIACRSCGTLNEPTAASCASCWAPLAASAQVDAGPAAAPDVEPSAAEPAGQGGALGETAGEDEPAGETCPRCHASTPLVNGRCRFCDPPQGAEGQVSAGQAQAGRARAGRACLMTASGLRADLPEGVEIVLGRESDNPAVCGLLAGFDAVSRRHAAITVKGGTVEVHDLGSMNGTWVDGRQLGSVPVFRPMPVEIGLGTECTVTVRANDEQ